MSAKTKALCTGVGSLPVIGGGIYYSLPGASPVLDAQTEVEEKNKEASLPQHLLSIAAPTNLEPFKPSSQPTPILPQPRTVSKSTEAPTIKFSDGDAWLDRELTDQAPYTKEYPEYMREELNSWKTKDPVLYRYHYDNTFKTKVGLDHAKGKLDVMMDHTFLLAYTVGCHLGTAWIMDYVLPDETKGEKYPTRWIMASDAHVVSAVTFDRDNPYQQVLPNPDIDLKGSWRNSDCIKYYKKNNSLTLIKEKVNHQESDFNKANWSIEQKKHQGKEMWVPEDKYNVFKQKNNPNADSEWWQVRNYAPKLLYFPHNYIKKEKWVQGEYKEHWTDFAIFEVNFQNETVAKLWTRDFYGKYDPVVGRHKEKALNFFAEPLHKKYTSQQLLEKDPKIWMAGYPMNGMHHKATSNYNISNQSPSRFAYFSSPRDEHGRLMLGASTTIGEYTWNGKISPDVAYSYAFDNPEVTFGASGSLVATDEGDVLGSYSWVSPKWEGYKHGGATALRNMEIKDENGKIIYPAYDFLEGSTNQNGSYKEQIQKYFLPKGLKTNFSRLRNWTVK